MDTFWNWLPTLVWWAAAIALIVILWRWRAELRPHIGAGYRTAVASLRDPAAVLGAIISVFVAGVVTYIILPFIPPLALGVLAAILALMFIVPVLPGVAELLSNKPNRFRPHGDTERLYREDAWGLFIFLQPGRVSLVERGDSFVRALMDWDGKMFLGEQSNTLSADQWEYWRVVDSGGYPDSHPLPFPTPKTVLGWLRWAPYSPASILFWIWKRWIYLVTGAVFVGIPPYQNVRVYPMDRFRLFVQPDGETQLIRVKDYSNHYRVAEFQFPTAVPRADSQDLIEVKWRVNQVARVDNPFMAAYNTDDDWSARYFAALANGITNTSRSRPVAELIGTPTLLASQRMGEEITGLTQVSVESFGFVVIRTEVIDVTPTDTQVARKLGDKAVAIVDRDAAVIRAEGLAAPIRQQGQALRDFPEAALIPQNEAMVRAAAAAGDKAIVMLGGGKGMTQGQAALIKEIREISESRRTP